MALWSERWQSSVDRLRGFEVGLRAAGVPTFRGGEFDRWDLEVRGGALGAARVLMAVEEHGGGRQLVRLRIRPRFSIDGLVLALALAGLALAAGHDRAGVAAALLGLFAALVLAFSVLHSGFAIAAVLRMLPRQAEVDEAGEASVAWTRPTRTTPRLVGVPALPVRGDDSSTAGARMLATSIREFTSGGW